MNNTTINTKEEEVYNEALNYLQRQFAVGHKEACVEETHIHQF